MCLQQNARVLVRNPSCGLSSPFIYNGSLITKGVLLSVYHLCWACFSLRGYAEVWGIHIRFKQVFEALPTQSGPSSGTICLIAP